jgi:serine/threonine-protein kinase RsbW
MQTLTLPANLDALAQISLFITDAASGAGLDERATWQMQLAVDEAATNIIQHAYDGDVPGEISLTWRSGDERFIVELRDQGRGFNPNDIPQPDLLSPLEEREIGGLGIYLMTRLMDEVHFDFDPRDGNLVTMVKYLVSGAHDAVTVLPLSGRMDAQTGPDIKARAQELIEQGTRHLLIDLSAVEFLSSSGLRTLLLIRKELLILGGELRLAAPQPHVREVFDLTGFAQVFALHDTVEEARLAFEQSHS